MAMVVVRLQRRLMFLTRCTDVLSVQEISPSKNCQDCQGPGNKIISGVGHGLIGPTAEK
jgi:hypothetical protein